MPASDRCMPPKENFSNSCPGMSRLRDSTYEYRCLVTEAPKKQAFMGSANKLQALRKWGRVFSHQEKTPHPII